MSLGRSLKLAQKGGEVVPNGNHKALGVRRNGKYKAGGYLVSFERLGLLVVARVGPYQALGLSQGGAKSRLFRKFEKYPELGMMTYEHDENIRGEKI